MKKKKNIRVRYDSDTGEQASCGGAKKDTNAYAATLLGPNIATGELTERRSDERHVLLVAAAATVNHACCTPVPQCCSAGAVSCTS